MVELNEAINEFKTNYVQLSKANSEYVQIDDITGERRTKDKAATCFSTEEPGSGWIKHRDDH